MTAASAEERQRSLELYAEARELHEQHRYGEARIRYEESLELHHDAEVEGSYLRLLATIGPL